MPHSPNNVNFNFFVIDVRQQGSEDMGSDDHMDCVAGLRGSQMINAWKDRQQSAAGGEIASILNNDMIEAL